MHRKLNVLSIFFSLFLLLGCDKVFEYSPYSAFVPNSKEGETEKNLKRLYGSSYEKGFAPFKFALISDSHLWYNELKQALLLINDMDSIEFVIHGGDLTDGGLIKEYDIFLDEMKNLNVPYFTVIGNHDLLANGRSIYSEIYGNENYSFVYKECKFIFFNNVVWELDFAEPDFRWLRAQLIDRDQYKHVFVTAHIPPWSEQFFLSYYYVYFKLMHDFNVSLTIHGHHHHHSEFSGDTILEFPIANNLIIGSPQYKVFRTVDVTADTVIFKTHQY